MESGNAEIPVRRRDRQGIETGKAQTRFRVLLEERQIKEVCKPIYRQADRQMERQTEMQDKQHNRQSGNRMRGGGGQPGR